MSEYEIRKKISETADHYKQMAEAEGYALADERTWNDGSWSYCLTCPHREKKRSCSISYLRVVFASINLTTREIAANNFEVDKFFLNLPPEADIRAEIQKYNKKHESYRRIGKAAVTFQALLVVTVPSIVLCTLASIMID